MLRHLGRTSTPQRGSDYRRRSASCYYHLRHAAPNRHVRLLSGDKGVTPPPGDDGCSPLRSNYMHLHPVRSRNAAAVETHTLPCLSSTESIVNPDLGAAGSSACSGIGPPGLRKQRTAANPYMCPRQWAISRDSVAADRSFRRRQVSTSVARVPGEGPSADHEATA